MSTLRIRGQVIKKLYRSSQSDNWALLETDKAIYELRLGGLRRTVERRSDNYVVDLLIADREIIDVLTDNFSLYFELDNGQFLMHSDTWIDGEGNTNFEVKLISEHEFAIEKEDLFNSGVELKGLY